MQVPSKKVSKEGQLERFLGIILLGVFFVFLCGIGWAFTEKSQVLIMAFSALAGIFGFVGGLLLLNR